MANYIGFRAVVNKPLSVFGTIFSFFIPPLGFLLAMIGFSRDKKYGNSYSGWIVLMVISVLMTGALIAIFITGSLYNYK